MEMIGKGAEANIYLDGNAVIKERIRKTYRVKELDESLRSARTKKEAKLISMARGAGVPTPFIINVDNTKTSLTIEYVNGKQIKKILNAISKDERKRICREIGRSAGKLHKNHVIHGDLTTSNMIIKDDKIYFIDFGLGEVNEAVEAKGVDLLVFKKSLRSTHFKYEEECLDAFLEGYMAEYGDCTEILKRLDAIEKRGRYFSER
ncbi:MAG: KEOPS complex kinase/ATPase Bud32 [Candidatus Hydrothermarchaeaceae archaeon]